MRTSWLYKKSGRKLLVFFSGWGIDSHPFQHLGSKAFDVLFVDQYVDLDFADIPSVVAQYDHSVMVGWSMGVWVISRLLNERPLKVDSVCAINGTEQPVHAHYGIDPQWFKATIDQFDREVLDKFYRRMCGDKKRAQIFNETAPQRSLESLKEELEFLYGECHNRSPVINDTVFNSALVSTRDMIFPASNQKEAWSRRGVDIVDKKDAHFCFQELECWDDVVFMMQNLGI